jgi:hypothetical protein
MQVSTARIPDVLSLGAIVFADFQFVVRYLA